MEDDQDLAKRREMSRLRIQNMALKDVDDDLRRALKVAEEKLDERGEHVDVPSRLQSGPCGFKVER